jgi:acetyl-CoA carboxylase biotin carboxyl carrier protein
LIPVRVYASFTATAIDCRRRDDRMSEIRAPITGNVWKVLVAEGDPVAVDDVVAILESMKLEIPVEAECAGTVVRVLVAVGDAVGEDDTMFELE